MPNRAFSLLALACLLSSAQPVLASHPPSLADFSLEELSNLVVTTVSRRQELVQEAPAAVYVITQNDIRLSGATSLPEALRLAPNLQVAQADASQYAITARGGNSLTANNLLVLIDGRIVYTPLYSGVFWDAQHLMLEDVERIEVISGPGATMWGANAVNGVINVITRSARDTQGSLLTLEAGDREYGVGVRHGTQLGDNGHFRIYGKGFQRTDTRQSNGLRRRDDAQTGQAGFRADWGAPQNRFTVQSDIYNGRTETSTEDRNVNGANLTARWYQEFQDGAHLNLLAYYDRTEREHSNNFAETLDTVNLELQHGLARQGNHKLLWGAGYRHSRDDITNSAALAFLPARKTLNYAHVFVQDHIRLSPQLDLTLGLKLESNPYTEWETLPNLRLAYKPDASQLWWTSLSRAVRTPARLDRDFYVPGVPPYTVVAGGPNFRSEVADVLEVGYRGQPSAALSYSITAFHHRYDRLRSVEPSSNGPILENLIEGRTSGFELWGSYRITERWTLSGGWTEMDIKRTRKPGSLDTTGLRALGNDPKRTLQLRSSSHLSSAHTLDLTARHVASLPDPAVPAYTVLDARLGWQITPHAEASVLINNVFDDEHAEWGAGAGRAVFGRNIMLRLVWRL